MEVPIEWSLKMLNDLQKHPKILEISMIPHLSIHIYYNDCLGKANVHYKMFFFWHLSVKHKNRFLSVKWKMARPGFGI